MEKLRIQYTNSTGVGSTDISNITFNLADNLLYARGKSFTGSIILSTSSDDFLLLFSNSSSFDRGYVNNVLKFTPSTGVLSASEFSGKLHFSNLIGYGTESNLVIVSTGTGWELKTLGSNAFDEGSYLPVDGTALSAFRLTTVSKTAWGQKYWTDDGIPTDISGNMTNVGSIAMNGDITISTDNLDRYITFDTGSTNSWRIGLLGTGSGDNNHLVFLSTKDTSDSWVSALTITNETLESTFASTVTAPTFQGNLDGTYVNQLTDYTKASEIGSIDTTDSLNVALGKLEFKTDFIYNDLFGTDNDDVINKWSEIVDFIDSVAEGTDITDEFVTRKTDQTITGVKTFQGTITIGSELRDKKSIQFRGGAYLDGYGNFHLDGTNETENAFHIFKTNSDGTRTSLFHVSDSDYAVSTGTFTASKLITSGGTSSLFVKGDGSLDSNTYATTTSLGSYLPLAGGTMNSDAGIKWPQGTSSTWDTFGLNTYQGLKLLNTVGSSSTNAPYDYAVGLSVSGYYGFCLSYYGGGNIWLLKGSGDSNWKTILHSDNTYIDNGTITINGISITPLTAAVGALPFFKLASGNANDLSQGLTTVTAIVSNQEGDNHSAFLTITDIGTPFQLQIPDSSTNYIYKRYKSGSTWSAWSKLSAGYADTAGSVAWGNVSGKPTSLPANGGNADTVDGKHASDFATASHTHPYLPLSGGTIEGEFGALSIKRNNAYASGIRFENTSGVLGYIGMNDDFTARIWDKDQNEVGFLIHSGNIGSQSVNYASSAGNADTVDGYHATIGNNKPWGTIPVITPSGYMDVGRHFEFHYDNTTGSDYSTVLMCTGNYSNVVNLPSESGTLALTSDIPTVSNSNGYVPRLVSFPAHTYFGSSTDTYDYLKNIVKWIYDNANYGDKTYLMGVGNPNSLGMMNIQLYGTSGKNSEGWPRYCSGTFLNLGDSSFEIFGTADYNYYRYRLSVDGHGHRITKLHRRDANDDYSLQHHWTGSYWYLRGYLGDSYHAGVQVAYADNSGYASSADNADKLDGIDSTSFLKKVTVANNSENDFNTFENMTLTGRGDPTTGASLKNAPWTGTGPAGGYGVLTYLWSGYGTQMAWGYNSNRIYIRNRYYSSGAVWQTSWDSIALTSDIPTVTNYYWANVPISATSNSNTSPTFLNVYVTENAKLYGQNVITSFSTHAPYTDVWSDGTNSHPWYGYDHRYGNTGVYSTTLSDYYGMTLRTASVNISMTLSNVGIGITNPTYKLEVAGSICGTVLHANRDASPTEGGVSLYYNEDPMIYGIAFRGTGAYGTHGYVTSEGDWATYLTMNDSTTRGWIFRRGSTNVASIAGSGNMAIGQHLRFSNDAIISTNRSTDYHYGYTFDLGDSIRSIGMYSGPGGEAGGVVISPDSCLIYNSSDCGYNLQVRDKDLGSDLTSAATLTFGIEQDGHYAWSRGGFKKNGSDNTYVLLGGGGHKLESSLSVNYANEARLAEYIYSYDTRDNTITPSTYGNGLRVHFLANGTNGVSDGGDYYGLIHIKHYGGTADHTGGYPHQIAFTPNNNLWHRIGTSSSAWGSWIKILDSNNYAATLDERYVNVTGDTITGDIVWLSNKGYSSVFPAHMYRNFYNNTYDIYDHYYPTGSGNVNSAANLRVKYGNTYRTLYFSGDGTFTWNGQAVITTGNIGSQSVNYANSAGYANLAGNATLVNGYSILVSRSLPSTVNDTAIYFIY